MKKMLACLVAIVSGFIVSNSANVYALDRVVQGDEKQWSTLSEPEFQKLLIQYQANPTLLAEERDIIKQLSGDQLRRAIEFLQLTHFTYLHPVVLRPNQYPLLNDRPISSISLQTVREDTLIPIPFQVDEIDEKGWVYTGENAPYDLLGEEGVYDENDELIFMYRDTGTVQYDPLTMPEPPGGGKIVEEIVLQDNLGRKRYAYVVEGSEARNNADYVLFDMPTGTADTVFYNFKTKPDNFLVFEDFKANVGDWQHHRIVDAILVDISTNVLTKWSPRISLNNFDNLQAVPIASKDGPVRAATLVKLWVVVANVPVFRIIAQLNVWDQGLGLPIRINIPGAEVLTNLLVNPLIDIAIDFNEMTGARVNSAISPDPMGYALVDGKIGDFEQQAQITLENNWLWMESGHGWDVFFNLDVPDDVDIGVSLFYQDDPKKVYKNESFPGAWPRVGYRIDRLPSDRLNIDVDVQFWFPDTVGKTGPLSFEKEMNNAPAITVRPFQAGAKIADLN